MHRFGKKNTMPLTILSYEGNAVAFEVNGRIMVNATQMARPFGKNPKDFTKTLYAREFMQVLSDRRNVLTADLLIVKKGGQPNEQGTWMHEDLALEFARWLSPDFAIWCNDQIKEMLKSKLALSNAQIKQKFITGEIKLTLPEIKGIKGARYKLMPSEFWQYSELQWCYTNFYINQKVEAIETAIDENGKKWYNLPRLLTFMGMDSSSISGFIANCEYREIEKLCPFNKAYKRYCASEKIIAGLGFGNNKRLQISGEMRMKSKRIPDFEKRMLAIIDQVKTLDEKEFLIDLYKLFK